MCSLRSLIPFRLSHLLVILCSSDPPCVHYCMLVYLTGNFILLIIGHFAARPARSPVHLNMRMRSSVHLGARAHPGLSCDYVNQLASCSFARKGSQEKTLRVESPLSDKHLWKTVTLESSSFTVTGPPHVSVLFKLILPRRPF